VEGKAPLEELGSNNDTSRRKRKKSQTRGKARKFEFREAGARQGGRKQVWTELKSSSWKDQALSGILKTKKQQNGGGKDEGLQEKEGEKGGFLGRRRIVLLEEENGMRGRGGGRCFLMGKGWDLQRAKRGEKSSPH